VGGGGGRAVKPAAAVASLEEKRGGAWGVGGCYKQSDIAGRKEINRQVRQLMRVGGQPGGGGGSRYECGGYRHIYIIYGVGVYMADDRNQNEAKMGRGHRS
jgi:hypothetical protein